MAAAAKQVRLQASICQKLLLIQPGQMGIIYRLLNGLLFLCGAICGIFLGMHPFAPWWSYHSESY
jgi:hypothetical protein